MGYTQIPMYKCSGNMKLLSDAIKSINKKKYEIHIDGAIITIKEKVIKK